MTVSLNTAAPASRSSNAQSKSSPSKAATANVKKTGITVKRKPAAPTNTNTPPPISNSKPASPTAAANKKNKKTASGIINGKGSSPSTSAPVAASFDLEATLCPICDEACTCPKTSAPVPVTSVKKPPTNGTKKTPLTSTVAASKNSNSIKKKDAPKYLNNNSTKQKLKSYELTESSDFEDEGDFDDGERVSKSSKIAEDPALSFIRMIYSDEESLDEEEAYALYQATQLFSSSDEEEYEARGFTSKRIDENDSDEYTTDSDDEDDNEFEYTVVEYVQPIKKSSKKPFVAYDSDEDDEEEEGDSGVDEASSLSVSLQDQLLLNARESDQDEEMDSCDEEEGDEDDFASSSDEDDGNWLTYSVFDVDSDLPNLTGGNGGTCLSSHGSGTPDTLLFSTSSTDKIPNIAPQVLAAISAAAKHMAANNQSGGTMGASTSKYFSYITLRETAREYVDGEEFLFFEEARGESDTDEELELEDDEGEEELDIEESDCVSTCDSIHSLDSLSDGGVPVAVGLGLALSLAGEEADEDDSFSDETLKKKRPRSLNRPAPPPAAAAAVPVVSTMSVSSDFMTSLNRWSRVPIGAFRRSRRPSIPSFHHSVHPSTALKTFSADPASLTLTPSPSHHSAPANEDSFDEAASCNMGIEGPERSYSVITWDELDLDIVPNTNNTPTSSPSSLHTWPLPKRSRSVVSGPTSLANNFEWLNNSNWNWEI